MRYIIIYSLIIILSNQIFSQFGPGGVGNSSNNGLWLKADDIDQENNTSLSTWIDTSGNLNNANQTTTTSQPIFFNTSSLNNMPVVRLDGSDDQLIITDSPILDGTSGITYYTVLRPNNLNGSPRGILGKRVTFTDPTNYAYTWFFWSGSRLYLDVNNNDDRFSTPTSFSNATNYLLSWNFDGTLPEGERSEINSEGTTILNSTESVVVLPNSNRNLVIGALNEDYGTYLGADYGEIIHFNYALDTTDHIMVQNYLSAKYDIAITSNDYYIQDDAVNGNYDFDVAGIGQINNTDFNDDAQGSGIVRILNPSDLNDNEFLIWGHDSGIQQATETSDVPSDVNARFDRVWRVNEVNSTNSSIDIGSIDIRFDLTGLGSVNVSDLRLLVDVNNNSLFNDDISISGATYLGENVYQFSNISAIENNFRFTLGTINSSQTPLPIELISFNASLSDNDFVKLDWQTASEINNDYFTIERSIDGYQWKKITTVNAAGNSSSISNYTYYDATSKYTGALYYRLKQTDFNGQFKYSNIEFVNIEDIQHSQIKLYPNPASNQVFIQGDANELEEILIYNTLGQDITILVQQIKVNKTKYFIDLSYLKSGMYYIKTKTTTNKLYKQ